MQYLVDVINYNPHNVTVYGTTIFEYIPGMPTTFTPVYPVWLDSESSCDAESLRPAFVNSVFNYTGGDQYVVPAAGKIIQMAGHIDDGGVAIQFLLNNQTICNSTTTYAATSAFIDPTGDLDKNHISNMTSCSDVGYVKKGDLLNVRALYDTMMWPPMVYPNNQTEATAVIGIGLAYIANTTVANTTCPTGATWTSSSMPTTSSVGATSTSVPMSDAAMLSRGVGLAATFVIAVIVSLY